MGIKLPTNFSHPFQLSSNNRYRCAFPVSPRQEGLQYDGCNRWQHHTCHTGISQSQYRVVVQAEEPIDWSCDLCLNVMTAPDVHPPDFESSRLEEESLQESGEPLFFDEATFGECIYKTVLNINYYNIDRTLREF